jgi:hypothetical protein
MMRRRSLNAGRLLGAWLLGTILATSSRADSLQFVVPVTPQPNEAIIYFYRDSLVSDFIGVESFYVRGLKVCDLRRNEYSCVAVPAGHYTITARNALRAGPPVLNGPLGKGEFGGQYLTISSPFVPGKTYFVEYKLRSNPLTNQTTWSLKLIAETVAMKDLAKCTFVPPTAEKLTTLVGQAIEERESEQNSPAANSSPQETGFVDRLRARLRR